MSWAGFVPISPISRRPETARRPSRAERLAGAVASGVRADLRSVLRPAPRVRAVREAPDPRSGRTKPHKVRHQSVELRAAASLADRRILASRRSGRHSCAARLLSSPPADRTEDVDRRPDLGAAHLPGGALPVRGPPDATFRRRGSFNALGQHRERSDHPQPPARQSRRTGRPSPDPGPRDEGRPLDVACCAGEGGNESMDWIR